MYGIWANCPSESEWYEKMIRMLKKHDFYHKWSDVTISYLYSVFCQIACNEPIPDMDVIFDHCGMDLDEWLEFDDINVSLEIIDTYMKENKLTQINLESFRDVLSNRVYERVHVLKHEFWSALNMEFRDLHEKLLFFYVREEHYKRAYNTDTFPLDGFIDETDPNNHEYVLSDSKKDDNNKQKTVLYSFLNHYNATCEETILRVCNWIERNTSLQR